MIILKVHLLTLDYIHFLHLNSNMIILKDEAKEFLKNRYEDLNSNMIILKVHQTFHNTLLKMYLNSNMIILKG